MLRDVREKLVLLRIRLVRRFHQVVERIIHVSIVPGSVRDGKSESLAMSGIWLDRACRQEQNRW